MADSLIDLGEDPVLNEEAVEMFSLLQKTMGDYPSTKHPGVCFYSIIVIILL
jgi:hypothetical protein